jgi:hypothetical protein
MRFVDVSTPLSSCDYHKLKSVATVGGVHPQGSRAISAVPKAHCWLVSPLLLNLFLSFRQREAHHRRTLKHFSHLTQAGIRANDLELS